MTPLLANPPPAPKRITARSADVAPAGAYRTVNPFDGAVLKTYPLLTATKLEKAIHTASACFGRWRLNTYAARAVVVAKAADLLRADADRFARLATLEMGKRLEEARGEVMLSADILEYYAANAERFLAPEALHCDEGQAVVESAPLGVIFGVQPWNFPYYQLARFAAPNLMAGNVVMVKHAACVPQCATAFEELWCDAGAPAGAYTNLRITHDQVNQVIDDPRVQGVALTGGIEAARSVAERAGRNVKRTTMELGGNDAFLVLADADLDWAVDWAVWAKMNNTGQCCVAAKRFILVGKIADAFLAKFSAALAALKPGDPMDKATTLAPMSSEGALGHLLDQVRRAQAHGARVLLGGNRLERPGAFMQPTILADIDPSNPAYREELFGPVALMFRVKDEDAAVTLANDSDFGLGASIFTRDVERGRRLASRLDCGMVFINHPTWTACELPFGGIKNSGYGRELSRLGIQEFVNRKLVRVLAADAAP